MFKCHVIANGVGTGRYAAHFEHGAIQCFESGFRGFLNPNLGVKKKLKC